MTTLELVLPALLLASPASAAKRLVLPAADVLLDAALTAPTSGYAARARVQYFPTPDAAKGQTRETRSDGAGRVRVESYAKKKAPTMMRVFDGATETLYAAPLKRAWRGAAPAPDAAALRRHRERLGALYDVSVSTGGRVAKRPTWRLTLRSKADGRVRRTLWVDRETSFPLKREDFRPDGTLRLRERTLRWAPAAPDAEVFRLDVPVDVNVTPRREPYIECSSPRRARPCSAPGLPVLLPAWLPEGYMLFDILGSTRPSLVTAFMDGHVSASFVTVPAGQGVFTGTGEKPYASVALKDGTGELYWGKDGACLAYRGRDRDGAFCGDLAEDELARVLDSLEPAR